MFMRGRVRDKMAPGGPTGAMNGGGDFGSEFPVLSGDTGVAEILFEVRGAFESKGKLQAQNGGLAVGFLRRDAILEVARPIREVPPFEFAEKDLGSKPGLEPTQDPMRLWEKRAGTL